MSPDRQERSSSVFWTFCRTGLARNICRKLTANAANNALEIGSSMPIPRIISALPAANTDHVSNFNCCASFPI
jgi:hypothetical protein